MIINQNPSEFKLHILTHADYEDTHADMLGKTLARIDKKKQNNQDNTDNKQDNIDNKATHNDDELWLVEHNDVYTLGQAGKPEHILQRNDTPIIKTDRGGQITWHGTGQLVVYWLFDLTALDWKVRDLVSHAEQAIEDVVNQYLKATQYYAKARSDAPGVYIYARHTQDNDASHDDKPADMKAKPHEDVMLGKIASLGFKIKQGFSYHGIALNIDCDLSAFNAINPCGYAGMQMLRLVDFVTPSHLTDGNQTESQTNNQTDSQTNTQSAHQPTHHSSLYDEVAQALVDNIGDRHKGNIALR